MRGFGYIKVWVTDEPCEHPDDVRVIVEQERGARRSVVVARKHLVRPEELNLVAPEGF